jgi:hypothetical protein
LQILCQVSFFNKIIIKFKSIFKLELNAGGDSEPSCRQYLEKYLELHGSYIFMTNDIKTQAISEMNEVARQFADKTKGELEIELENIRQDAISKIFDALKGLYTDASVLVEGEEFTLDKDHYEPFSMTCLKDYLKNSKENYFITLLKITEEQTRLIEEHQVV